MPRIYTRKHVVCTVEGCGRAHTAFGLCFMHYMRKRRNKEIEPARRDKEPEHDELNKLMAAWRAA